MFCEVSVFSSETIVQGAIVHPHAVAHGIREYSQSFSTNFESFVSIHSYCNHPVA
jgi:hypothetical protein